MSTKQHSELLGCFETQQGVVISKCVFQPCSSSRRPVSLFVRGRLHTGASQEKRKEAILIL
jgi:alkylhydroperoxidase/carboxymuconolactone decarboxylase family protein YurZ